MAAKTSTHGESSLSMSGEDYLEAIYRLATADSDDEGVHSVDVAENLGVSKASVNKALTALRESGMVEQARYGRIRMTTKGREYGRDVWRRHRTLRTFLTEALEVDPQTADEEACLMEHDLSADTMRRWVAYLEHQGITVED